MLRVSITLDNVATKVFNNVLLQSRRLSEVDHIKFIY